MLNTKYCNDLHFGVLIIIHNSAVKGHAKNTNTKSRRYVHIQSFDVEESFRYKALDQAGMSLSQVTQTSPLTPLIKLGMQS